MDMVDMQVENKNTAEKLAANVVHLISLPNIYNQLEKTLKDPNHTRNDIAKIVSIDPALSARILRVINSSYYGLVNPVQSIALAVNLLGEYDLRNMVLITSVVNSVVPLIDDGFDIHAFWQHSIRVGLTAKALALETNHADADLLFVTGLLHDLGRLIIYKNERELSNTVSWHVSSEGQERYLIELNLLGFNHAEVGYQLAKLWELPEKLRDIIRYHHQPEGSLENKVESKIVHFADQLVHYLEYNEISTNINFGEWPKLKNPQEEFNIDAQTIADLLNDVLVQSKAIEEIICEV